MLAEVEVGTTEVLTGKAAIMAPAGTVNVEGAPAAPLSVDSRTNAPPAGSGPLSVTMPIGDCAPPTTLVGVSAREETVGGGEARSKIITAGFGSLSGTTTNFVFESMYAVPLQPSPSDTAPLPFVGDEEME